MRAPRLAVSAAIGCETSAPANVEDPLDPGLDDHRTEPLEQTPDVHASLPGERAGAERTLATGGAPDRLAHPAARDRCERGVDVRERARDRDVVQAADHLAERRGEPAIVGAL